MRRHTQLCMLKWRNHDTKIGHSVRILYRIGSRLAADVGGVKLDDKMSVGGQELVLNGAGIRTKGFFKVYVGSL